MIRQVTFGFLISMMSSCLFILASSLNFVVSVFKKWAQALHLET